LDNINIALDIGTHKVACLVAQKSAEGNVKILGIGITESEGLNRGVVTHIDKTVNTIKKVISQAEQQSGIKIEDVTVGIAGDHIEALQTRCLVGISGENPEIKEGDVTRILEEAKKLPIHTDRSIIHIMPSEYIIDGQDGITDPIGMSGGRLEGIIHVITGLKSAISNIERCVERAGLRVKDIVLEPIASSRSVLTNEEKEVGVAIVDIGGGTTDVAVFQDNVLRFTSIFALAGKHVTEDIKEVLKIISQKAEKLKKEYGHCYGPSIHNDEIIMIPGVAGRPPVEVSKSYLCEIVEPRMEELFSIALEEINRSGFANRLGAGVVITGGTCLLRGTEMLAHDVFNMPVKLGIPTGITYTGLGPEVESPVYATGVGLALWAFDKDEEKGIKASAKKALVSEKNADTNNQKNQSSHTKPKLSWKTMFKKNAVEGDAAVPEAKNESIVNTKANSAKGSGSDTDLKEDKGSNSNIQNLSKKLKDFVEQL
jgi:cell division protein FtsA